MTSAFTNSSTWRAPCSRSGAAVLLPAPFGPASRITLGSTTTIPTQSETELLEALERGDVVGVGVEQSLGERDGIGGK